MDVDEAQYISSLIPVDRGKTRTLSECYYGDESKDFNPVKQFVDEMDKHPELWRVAKNIEGLINRSGLHAGGVIFVDEPFTNSTALMRSPDGTICTQYELHDAEKVSLIKYDSLSVEAMDKIHICLDLLCDGGYVERKPTLKETYESAIGVYNLKRDNPEMWDMVWNHKINSLFQMEQQSGIQGIALIKPKSVDELAVLNSVIRLQAQEKGDDIPLEKWAKYRKNIKLWYNEMREYGLADEEIEWLSNHSAITDGICESQEGMMALVQEERLGGNTLNFADKCRKAIAKKQGKLFEECEQFFFKNAEEKGCNPILIHYVWDVIFRTQRGYSFNKSHTLAYSLIALQEMNLAFNYPIIFWNCACLISDAGGDDFQNDNEEEENNEKSVENYFGDEEDFFDPEEEEVVDIYEEEDQEEYEYEDSADRKTKTKKKRTRSVDYGKIAVAIGKMKATGIKVSPPNINKSTYTFSPDVESNTIRYGMSGITRIGDDIVRNIIANRPYTSIQDLTDKVKVNKLQVINLIKAGCFDDVFSCSRSDIMKEYVDSISDKKKRLTLQNMRMLIEMNKLPAELNFEKRTYNFNKYLKNYKDGEYYLLDEKAIRFYEANFNVDCLSNTDGTVRIEQKVWDKCYKKAMEKVKKYIADHPELLYEVNQELFEQTWEKYANGSENKWEMDSLSYYNMEHELANVNNTYSLADFNELPEEPIVDRTFNGKDNNKIFLYKLSKIAGTVIDKNKAKHTITLLTVNGVVEVKLYKTQFVKYDKQISKKGADGKKKVMEKSWFSRGNKLLIQGIRRGNNFIPKTYKNSEYSYPIMLIDSVDENGMLHYRNVRVEE